MTPVNKPVQRFSWLRVVLKLGLFKEDKAEYPCPVSTWPHTVIAWRPKLCLKCPLGQQGCQDIVLFFVRHIGQV